MNSVHAATTNGPPTAVIGLSLRLNVYSNSDAAPTAMSTGTSDSRARTTLQSRTVRNANTKAMAKYVSSTRFSSRLSSKPTPTTARPDGVALDPCGRVGGLADMAHDFGACVEAARAGAVHEVQRLTGGHHGRQLDVFRRHVVRLLHLRAGGGDVLRPGYVAQVAHDLDEARRGEQRRGVFLHLVAREPVEVADALVGEALVGLDVHAELAGGVDLFVEHVQVLDHLRLLVDPLDRVGLERELALDEDPAGEDDEARDGEPDRRLRRDAAEPDHEAAERSGAEVLGLRGRLVLADPEDRERGPRCC